MIRTIIAASVLAACPAFVLQASIIYSDFGPGESFDQDAGGVVSQSVDLSPSLSFISGVAQELTEVDFVTSIGEIGDLNQVTVSLSPDDGGHPGTVLASQDFTNAMGILGARGTTRRIRRWSFPGTIHPGRPARGRYLLDHPQWARAPGDVTWNYNNQLQSGYSEFESGRWTTTDSTLGAIQILGESSGSDSAPEPGTALLLGLGIMAVIGLRRDVR